VTAATVTGSATITTDTATDADGCASEMAGGTNDICVLELLQPVARDTVSRERREQRATGGGGGVGSGRVGGARRRCSVGGKCIWPASDWLRRLRHNAAGQREQLAEQEEEEQSPPRERDRRSSVLLMVLLSGSEMEAKAVVVSEQQAIKTTPQSSKRLSRCPTTAEDMDEAVDALWL
ncbi:hypothetical protein KR222_007638, partial [Zaprionus bogoriensis]